MSTSDDIWILGIRMTKFGKHPDRDVVDLASEAVLGALADGGVTMKDIGVIAAGNLMNATAGIGQQLQKQVGQTGVPVYNVANACATGATALRTAIMAVKSGEVDMGLAVGVEKLSGAGLLGGGGVAKADGDTWEPSGRFGAVASTDGRIGTNTMPLVLSPSKASASRLGASVRLLSRALVAAVWIACCSAGVNFCHSFIEHANTSGPNRCRVSTPYLAIS